MDHLGRRQAGYDEGCPSRANRCVRHALIHEHAGINAVTSLNLDNGYTIARLAPERPDKDARVGQGENTLVPLPNLTPGEAIVVSSW